MILCIQSQYLGTLVINDFISFPLSNGMNSDNALADQPPFTMINLVHVCDRSCWNGFIVADVFSLSSVFLLLLLLLRLLLLLLLLIISVVCSYVDVYRVFFSFSVFLIYCLVLILIDVLRDKYTSLHPSPYTPIQWFVYTSAE